MESEAWGGCLNKRRSKAHLQSGDSRKDSVTQTRVLLKVTFLKKGENEEKKETQN